MSKFLKEPDAAFLALANFFSKLGSELIFSKFFLLKKTSPLTSNLSLKFISKGIDLIVLTFSVTSSPISPSPLVIAWINLPFS